MPDPHPIHAPAGYIPQHAIVFAAGDGAAMAVSHAAPLPVAPGIAAAASAPLVGTAGASTVAGPFAPQLGRPIWLTLSGSWSGSVQLLRSTDGGTTRLPPSYADGSPRPSYAGAVNAPVAEETVAGATWYLAVALTAGTLSFRMEQ
jgi:hypothetical protein